MKTAFHKPSIVLVFLACCFGSLPLSPVQAQQANTSLQNGNLVVDGDYDTVDFGFTDRYAVVFDGEEGFGLGQNTSDIDKISILPSSNINKFIVNNDFAANTLNMQGNVSSIVINFNSEISTFVIEKGSKLGSLIYNQLGPSTFYNKGISEYLYFKGGSVDLYNSGALGVLQIGYNSSAINSETVYRIFNKFGAIWDASGTQSLMIAAAPNSNILIDNSGTINSILRFSPTEQCVYIGDECLEDDDGYYVYRTYTPGRKVSIINNETGKILSPISANANLYGSTGEYDFSVVNQGYIGPDGALTYGSKEPGWISLFDVTGASIVNYGVMSTKSSGRTLVGNAVVFANSPIKLFANYGRIELGNVSSPEDWAVWINGGPETFGISPDAQFIVRGEVNPIYDPLVTPRYGAVYYGTGTADSLKEVLLAGTSTDGVGDVDFFSKVLRFDEAPNLKTWTISGEDSGVVWEFAGDGPYSTQANTLIDIKQGVARVTTSKGFGNQFNTNGGRVNVGAKGTLDLNSQSPTISDITLNGGDGSGTLAEMIENTATIRGGAFTGTISSNGGLLSGVTGTNSVLNAKSGRTFLRDGVNLGSGSLTGGQLWAVDNDTAAFTDFTLNTVAGVPVEPEKGAGLGSVNPGLVVGIGDKDSYSMRIGVDAQGNDNGGEFSYDDGNIFIFTPFPESRASDPSEYRGIWNVLDFSEGDLTGAEYAKMFSNTYLLFVSPVGDDYYYAEFTEDGVPVNQKLLTREVDLRKGSLKVEIGGPNPNAQISDFCGSVQSGLSQDMFNQFPIMSAEVFSEGARRGFCPRNIDAAGQAMANYNNLLADTIFERTPMRRFTEVEVAAAEPVTELEVEPVVEPAAEPVRGLWSKSGELNDAVAGEYLEQKVDPQPLVIADAQIAADHQEQHLIEVNGRTYAEDDSLTAEYADVEGVRGWFRGFGGSSGDYNGETGTVYNPYGISGGGGVVGADVSLSESFQLGAYANYGDISLWQTNSGETFGGGGWNADGWGGGITADYWTNNFYVQGLLGATGFSGEQRRTINEYGAMYTAGTAKGEKSSSSMVGALRIGAPFQSGSTYFEPQFTATWSGNNENRFSESADDDRLGLTYKGRNTNYLQTALGMKFAWPMKTGETGLLTPSVKLAWLGDWNMGNEDQTIGFGFTDKTYSVGSNQENQNGGLIEAGLDYSVAKIESTTVKAYLRGGAEVWGGNRGTNWRASGGMTFQF